MKVRFNDLPQAVRERFVQLSQPNTKDPALILFEKGTPLGWFKWVVAVAGIPVIALFLNFFFEEGARKEPIHDKEVYGFFAFALFLFVASVIGIVYRFVWKPPPYREGTFALASSLVEADGGELSITPIVNMGRPMIIHTRRNGVYTGSRLELAGGAYKFYFGNQAAVESACDRVLQAREYFARASAAGDRNSLGQLDPFYECNASGSWTSPPGTPVQPPLAAVVPSGAKWARWLGALLFGVIVSGALFAIIDNVYEDDRKAYDRKFKSPSGPRSGKKY
ncbi:MAG: hypothetical protein ACXWP4_00940 [Polyangiales bacterium]